MDDLTTLNNPDLSHQHFEAPPMGSTPGEKEAREEEAAQPFENEDAFEAIAEGSMSFEATSGTELGASAAATAAGAMDDTTDVIEMGTPEIPEGADAGTLGDGTSAAKRSEEDVSIDLGAIAKMIPDKMAFKIGEVADIAGVKTYVLRYWESEFDALSPQKSAFNQRVYSKKDVETVLLIKKLLYEEKFSIAGAKRKIRDLRKGLKAEKQWAEVSTKVDKALMQLEELITDITSLKDLFN